ncbi:MAG: hypothetical protein EAX91_02335 [Candidatus Lokiarchaeota archaeon]|nr:hypothetical protein [Candidatus Lokiarchaeota archaeon]
MSDPDNTILFDSVKGIQLEGEFEGSIITRCKDDNNSIIFSDNLKISNSEGIFIVNGFRVGFELDYNKKSAFSRKIEAQWYEDFESIEYSILISEDIMQIYGEGQFSDAYPYTLNKLNTATLYFDDYGHKINHLDFFKGEMLKNPIALVGNGVIVADRVVIDERIDPVFYDCLIVGRDENENLSVSFEPYMNVKKSLTHVKYIIILGIEELKL